MKQLKGAIFYYNYLIFKRTKTNYFLILTNFRGHLLFYTTLKYKYMKEKHARYKLTLSDFINVLALKRIKFIVLEIFNFTFKLLKLTVATLKEKGLYILYVTIKTKKPHNGCRLVGKARKHKKRKFIPR